MVVLLKVLKFGALAGGILGGAIYVRESDIDYTNFGVLRLLRAGVTIGGIVLDYKINLLFKSPEKNAEDYYATKKRIHTRSARRLRDLCCKNGGVYIKVGQHIGSLDYLIPEEFVEQMRVLHYQVPRAPFEDVLLVLREELKRDPYEVFSSIDPEPIGSASLAQVHRAILASDGSELALKVQHRRVAAHSVVDTQTMDTFVRIVNRLFPEFSFTWLAEEMKRNLPHELDFVHEGSNCEQIERMLKKYKFFRVPKIHWPISTRRVLAMEYCKGGIIDDLAYYVKHDIEPLKVVRQLSQIYSEMIFVQGFVHCDPHPGNILVNKDKHGQPQVILLDHGLYVRLRNWFRYHYAHLWLALIKSDLPKVKLHAEALGTGELYALFLCMLTGRSWDSVTKGKITQGGLPPASEREHLIENAVNFLPQMAQVLKLVPREMLLIFKTNDLLKGIERRLGMPATKFSFLYMTKGCLEAVADERIQRSTSWWRKWTIRFSLWLNLMLLAMYETYLKFKYWNQLTLQKHKKLKEQSVEVKQNSLALAAANHA